jgi:transposase
MQTIRNTEKEVAVEPPTRRHRSKAERRQIAEESLQPGISVAVLARRHGVNANQVFNWRKLLREGRLDLKPTPSQLLPVRIAEAVEETSRPAHQQHTGAIQIEIGRVRIRVEGSVDPATLRVILEQLGR